jgi:RpiB/LacA/LacB family sugar-phosphate isomerase
LKRFNLLIPIAGDGQRFLDAGYSVPKPLIVAKDKCIIDWSMSSINTSDCNLIFVVRADHVSNFSIDEILRKKFSDIKIVIVDKPTRGSIETCVLAKKYIDNSMPLAIYCPDIYFKPQFYLKTINPSLDGFLLTFKANSPNYSYTQLDKAGYVTRTAEKQVISNEAAAGLYYFKSGKMFLKYAKEMISKDIKTNNEFYICPLYNQLIRDGLKIKTQQVEKMHVLGTSDELEFFNDNVNDFCGPVALCSDHSGFELKEKTKDILGNKKIQCGTTQFINTDFTYTTSLVSYPTNYYNYQNCYSYIDYGTYVERDCDYNNFVHEAAKAIKSGQCKFGFGFCRTGQGINIQANRYKHLRSALVFDAYTAEYAVRHNCANFFVIPSKYVDDNKMREIINAISIASFDGGRHMTRVVKSAQ